MGAFTNTRPTISKVTGICIVWWGRFKRFDQHQRLSCGKRADFAFLKVFYRSLSLEMKILCGAKWNISESHVSQNVTKKGIL